MCEQGHRYYRYYLSPSKKIHLGKDGYTVCAFSITEKWTELVDLYWKKVFEEKDIVEDDYEVCSRCDLYRAVLSGAYSPLKHSKFLGYYTKIEAEFTRKQKG